MHKGYRGFGANGLSGFGHTVQAFREERCTATAKACALDGVHTMVLNPRSATNLSYDLE